MNTVAIGTRLSFTMTLNRNILLTVLVLLTLDNEVYGDYPKCTQKYRPFPEGYVNILTAKGNCQVICRSNLMTLCELQHHNVSHTACFCSDVPVEIESNGCTELCGSDPCGGPGGYKSVYTACEPTKMGSSCMQGCQINNCEDDVCHIDSGECFSGCAVGWYGDRCTGDCRNCNGTCSDNGVCPNGCDGGYFGQKCDNTCPENCRNNTCDDEIGNCDDGCVVGYWHSRCIESCPPNCTGNVCSQDLGYCTSGCDPGLYGEQCSDSCPDNCTDSVCDEQTGNCYSCPTGYYRPDCSRSCPAGCLGGICELTTGSCTEGCELTWYSPYCNQSCPDNCLGGECEMDDGTCSNGCETGWESVRCEAATESDPNVGAIVGISIAILAVVVGLIVLILYLTRRNQERDRSTEGTYENVAADISDKNVHQKQSPDDQSISTDDSIQDKAVRIEDFPAYVEEKTKLKDWFANEYKRLPTETLYEWNAATRPEVKSKNRFLDIYPYDHNRVVLDVINGDPATDYINASRCQGYNTEERAIGCIGPKKNTADDFWRMIWNEKLVLIVMLTNTVEAGVDKCFQYWPSAGSQQNGELTVSIIAEDAWPTYVLRKFMVVKGNIKHFVTQYHFTVWPDHGVPADATSLLSYRRKCLFGYQPKNPAIVHCSAGVGRTGTIMAMDYLMRQAELEGKVDVFDCVYNLRHQRKHIIQTLDQYIFLHQALAQYFTVGIPTIPTAEFLAKYKTLVESYPGGEILTQYKMLEKLVPEQKTQDKVYAFSPGNNNKNRDKNIIPLFYSRVILTSRMSDRTDYINAVAVNSFQKINAFQVTQIPMANTVVDFWRMILDHDSNAIVTLLTQKQSDEAVAFLPTKEKTMDIMENVASVRLSTTVESFRTVDIILGDNVDVEAGAENNRASVNAKLVRVYQITVAEGAECIDYRVALAVFRELQLWKQQTGNKTATVSCWNGAKYSGQFLACHNLFEMINSEQEVDVFQVSKYIRDSRPEFIGSMEQYRGLHDAVDLYLTEFDMYSNFK